MSRIPVLLYMIDLSSIISLKVKHELKSSIVISVIRKFIPLFIFILLTLTPRTLYITPSHNCSLISMSNYLVMRIICIEISREYYCSQTTLVINISQYLDVLFSTRFMKIIPRTLIVLAKHIHSLNERETCVISNVKYPNICT